MKYIVWGSLFLSCALIVSLVQAGAKTLPPDKPGASTSVKPAPGSRTKPAQKPKPHTGKPAAKNAKIQSFLKTLEKAQSLDEVAKAFESSKFNKAEMETLDREMKKRKYANKLERFKQKAGRQNRNGNRLDLCQPDRRRSRRI